MVAGLRGRRESTQCAGAKPPCRVMSLAAFRHSLRIMSIDSLPEACVSLMTLDIIFFNPAGLITTPFLARVESDTPLMSVLGRREQA